MKKYLLLSAAVALLILSGCSVQVTADSSDKSKVSTGIETNPFYQEWAQLKEFLNRQSDQNTGSDQSTGSAQENLLSGTDPIMIKQAISDYLAAADLKGTGEAVVKAGDKISVQYVGRLNDHEVFDTSVESIAKASGKYSPARNYNEGLNFTVGAGQMIAGFDKGVVGMKLGQTKTITIPAKEAYGEWSGAYLITVPRSQLPEGEYKKGVQLMSANGQTFTVYEVKDDSVVLDGNHELAGKDLIFDITVVKIN